MIFRIFFRILKYHSPKITLISIKYFSSLFLDWLDQFEFVIRQTDSETSLKNMRDWTFSQKTKLKQKFLLIVKKKWHFLVALLGVLEFLLGYMEESRV